MVKSKVGENDSRKQAKHWNKVNKKKKRLEANKLRKKEKQNKTNTINEKANVNEVDNHATMSVRVANVKLVGALFLVAAVFAENVDARAMVCL